jgi:hypothetical protein
MQLIRACLGGLRLRLHERLRPEPFQTVEIAPAPGVEPELEPLAAFKEEVEPRFGGFTWLQLEIHQRSYFAKLFLKRLNSTREATPPEELKPELFLEETEPCQTDPKLEHFNSELFGFTCDLFFTFSV